MKPAQIEMVASVQRINCAPTRVEEGGQKIGDGFTAFMDFEDEFTLKVSVWNADHIAQTWIDLKKPAPMSMSEVVRLVKLTLKDKIMEERARESNHSKTMEH